MTKKIIEEIKAEAKENLVPIVRDQTLAALLDLAETVKAERVLEIGTAVGYSGLNLLENTNCHLTTIEKNVDRFKQAMDNFENAGVSGRVRALNGDAIEVLMTLKQEGEKFDFVFLDGPKGQYIKYLPLLKELLQEDGYIFADNVGVLGLVAHQELVTHKNRTMVRNMQAFLNEVCNSSNFETTVFDIDDGYAICHYVQKNDRND